MKENLLSNMLDIIVDSIHSWEQIDHICINLVSTFSHRVYMSYPIPRIYTSLLKMIRTNQWDGEEEKDLYSLNMTVFHEFEHFFVHDSVLT